MRAVKLPKVDEALVRTPPVSVESPVTPRVEERVAEESVASPVALSVLKVAPPSALSCEVMVVEPVTAREVEVAPLAVSPPLKAICVVVALEGNGYAKPPVVQGSGMREPSALTVRHWPAEAERPVTARFVVVA